jgi:hypothetical protein
MTGKVVGRATDDVQAAVASPSQVGFATTGALLKHRSSKEQYGSREGRIEPTVGERMQAADDPWLRPRRRDSYRSRRLLTPRFCIAR